MADRNASCLWIAGDLCAPLRNLLWGPANSNPSHDDEGRLPSDPRDTPGSNSNIDPSHPVTITEPPPVNIINTAPVPNQPPVIARAYNIPPNVRRYTSLEARRAKWGNARLGEGATTIVWKGVVDGHHVAIKELNADTQLDCFETEIKILSRLNHPSIVALVGVCVDGPHPYILYELMKGGTLEKMLNQSQQSESDEDDEMEHVEHVGLPWEKRLTIALDTISGLLFLHETSDVAKAVIHRDLKPANILLNEDLRGRIADFGYAFEVVKEDMPVEQFPAVGTIGYMDPVYVSGGQLSTGADIFAFGMILVEMVTGAVGKGPEIKIEEGAPDDFLSMIRDPKLEGASLEGLRALILLAQDCMAVELSERPSAVQIKSRLENILEMG